MCNMVDYSRLSVVRLKASKITSPTAYTSLYTGSTEYLRLQLHSATCTFSSFFTERITLLAGRCDSATRPQVCGTLNKTYKIVGYSLSLHQVAELSQRQNAQVSLALNGYSFTKTALERTSFSVIDNISS